MAVVLAATAACGGDISAPASPTVATAAVDPASATILAGATTQLSATVHDAQGSTLSGCSPLSCCSAAARVVGSRRRAPPAVPRSDTLDLTLQAAELGARPVLLVGAALDQSYAFS